ncbi:hypothetical protein BCR41DRAFT_355959 [Lobosporangium transversale]|uniref:Uncharacterized protein n=1 Tax=Lobosporangium transversale TaxID=64571 RepID=A0A1Y2GLY7_9FUNG|nr:hypothetical protein BCR41DRAFT_355959 [Lobosporangium transversale]ORZ12955.1 hypothetical protein BCR41DRAFT_355959 [Lobosporangium transversale]|eukprot:XP_021880304.1 hypothetical protein BCR41DRAFT_355959 [Lobosporangium transversale]
MSSYGGTVAAGSACAVLQSIGAAGLGTVGTIISGATVGAVAAGTTAVAGPESPTSGATSVAKATVAGASLGVAIVETATSLVAEAMHRVLTGRWK